MTPGVVPIIVEVCTTVLFCGVLVYLRKSLTARSIAFWTFLWVVKAAVSLSAVRFAPVGSSVVFAIYVPLQIAFALALVVIAARLENQKQQLRSLNEELARLRKDAASQLDLDPLTGLKNRSALARWMEEDHGFDGLVVVCDMDEFKQLNDNFGHLVGDEILHGVGKLISGSIRPEDLAFRWGGDEFVIFFRSQDAALVDSRMRRVAERLLTFHIRQHGTIPVQFSWGVASTAGRPLRDCLEEADRLMYDSKRARHLPQPPGTTPAGAR